MKKLSKKLLALLLVFAMLIPTGSLMVTTTAEEDETVYTDGVWAYKVVDGYAMMVGVTEVLEGDVCGPPSYLGGYPLKVIDGINCGALAGIRTTQFIIPQGVEQLTQQSFNTGLFTSVVMPLSLKYIDFNAFPNCYNFTTIYYEGTEEDWNNISIAYPGLANAPVVNATKYYNYEYPSSGEDDDLNSGIEKDQCIIIKVEKGGYVTDLSVTFYGNEWVGNITLNVYTIQDVEIPDGEVIVIPVYETLEGIFSDMSMFQFGEFRVEGGENITYTWEWGTWTDDDSEGDAPGEQFPDGYDPVEDKYRFTNSEIASVIETDIYKTVYGAVKGTLLAGVSENGKTHGLCYGMASTTAALMQNRTAIKSFELPVQGMVGEIECIHDIYEYSFSTLFNMETMTFIKYGHIYQYASSRDSTIGDLRNLYFSVKSYVEGNGSPVAISIWHKNTIFRENGHTILATGIKETNNEYIIMIDDSNFSNHKELYISKDFSTWSYSVDGYTVNGDPYDYNSSNGIIAYDTPGSVVYNIGILAGQKTRTTTSYLNENRLLVSSESALADNENLSEIFTTGITTVESTDETRFYWIDEDIHDVELSVEKDNSEVTVADINSSVSVVLNSDENASFCVDDENNNSVSYATKNNTNSEIVFTSVNDNGDIAEITLTGTANGDEVVASETENGIQVTGLNDITVTYETPDGTAETKAEVTDGSTVNITVNDDENKVETDWQDKEETETDEECKHSDANHDGICDACSEDFTKGCSCNCHGNAFMQFLHKIVSFLRKLFGMKQYQYCNCGKAHW